MEGDPWPACAYGIDFDRAEAPEQVRGDGMPGTHGPFSAQRTNFGFCCGKRQIS